MEEQQGSTRPFQRMAFPNDREGEKTTATPSKKPYVKAKGASSWGKIGRDA